MVLPSGRSPRGVRVAGGAWPSSPSPCSLRRSSSSVSSGRGLASGPRTAAGPACSTGGPCSTPWPCWVVSTGSGPRSRSRSGDPIPPATAVPGRTSPTSRRSPTSSTSSPSSRSSSSCSSTWSPEAGRGRPGPVILAPHWQADLPLVGVVVAVGLYLLGAPRRPPAGGSHRQAAHPWRTVSFLLALATILVALQPPLDSLVGLFLWAHMVQHLLLIGVTAPLMVAAAPWLRIWRGLPLGWRRGLARAVVTGRWSAPLRRGAGFLARPGEAWLGFSVDLLGWPLPWMYELAR